MIPAKGCIKNYHWGKVGDDSYIARFQAAPKTPTKVCINNNSISASNKSLDHNQHLAELWFGSHPSGPSTLIVGDHTAKLDAFLAAQPELVGRVDHYFKYNKQLPFLFKILSIGQPLSLQAHPDKKLAETLHKKDPKNYPDANHKPELAIALTEFHVLCDFRPHPEIALFIRELAPFRHVIGESLCNQYISSVSQANQTLKARALSDCFKSLMTKERDIVSDCTKQLLTKRPNAIGKDLLSVINHLECLYPGDPGVLAPLFLNYIKLDPGQAIYLEPNKLHAYLKGDCIECMACSDNVVRAGLTTKFRDIQTLMGMLTYETVNSSQDLVLNPTTKQYNGCTVDLFAPTHEFKVEKIVISDRHEHVVQSVSSGSFIIVLDGKATTRDFFDTDMKHKLSAGFAGFVPPDISIKLTDIQGKLLIYRAFC